MKTKILLILFVFFLWGCIKEKQLILDKSSLKDTYTLDSGQIKEGRVLKYNFILRNDSKKILTIKDVTTPCGCVISKIKKRNISPGENTLIKVKFDTKGYSGSTQQFIYVHTDDLDIPILRFIIKAEVIKQSVK